MGVQQSSFDFFNSTPEENKPEGKKLPKPNKPGTNLETDAESFPVDPVEKKMISPSEPDPLKAFIPDPHVPEIFSHQHVIADQHIELPEMVVDSQVRNLDFLVKEKAVKVPTQGAKKSTRGRMKLSEMDNMVDLVDVPADEVLFQKRYYNIGAVSEMFKVNISLIRFWENEFDILKPKKNGKGDRLFRPEDIKNLQLIYHLLREKKYTIDGAKDFLKKNKMAEDSFGVIDALKKIRSFLLELKTNL